VLQVLQRLLSYTILIGLSRPFFKFFLSFQKSRGKRPADACIHSGAVIYFSCNHRSRIDRRSGERMS